MVNTIGHRETEIALQTGAMYTSKQALNIGLVDQLAPVEDLPAVCHQHALNWAKVPGLYLIALSPAVCGLLYSICVACTR